MDINTLRQFMAQRDLISILETVDVYNGARTVLQEFDHVIEAPNWTRDGSHLVYNSQGHIYTYALATGEIRQVDTGYAIDCNNDHILSPDNTQLAVSHHTNEDAASRIYIVPLQGGSPRLVTDKGPSYLHGWSPDGKTLAYCAERGGQYDIFTIPVEGGHETQLTDLPGLDDGPEYSPDGRHIWFNSVRTGLMQIWRMEADGSNPVHMVQEDANCWFPHVSPDGNWVVYIAYGKDDVAPGDHPANKNVELRLIPSEGGSSTTIVKLFGGQGTINVNSWAPDNRTIAFVSYRLKQ
jgi:Tol biopolymer transport system component